jgi:hypothetical protein
MARRNTRRTQTTPAFGDEDGSAEEIHTWPDIGLHHKPTIHDAAFAEGVAMRRASAPLPGERLHSNTHSHFFLHHLLMCMFSSLVGVCVII